MIGEQIYIPRPGNLRPPRREDCIALASSHFGGKPGGGFWTSTFETSATDGWEGWCRGERMDWLADTGYLLTPVPEANVLTIAGGPDFKEFIGTYGVDRYPGRPQLLSMDIDWPTFVRDGHDGIRITNPYHPDIRFGPVIAFYGWDCESTWWSRWAFMEDVGRPVPIEPVDMRDDEEEGE